MLRLMAKATSKVDPLIVYPAAVPFLITLANTSLFSSMLTGGGLFLAGFLYLWGNAKMPGSDAYTDGNPVEPITIAH